MTPLMADGFPDDRVYCTQCQECDPARHFCRAKRSSTILALPLRCLDYKPLRSEADQRRGAERWLGLSRDILETSRLDKEFAERRRRS